MTSVLRKRAARAVLTIGLVMGAATCSSISTNITDVPTDVFAPSLGIDLGQMNLSPSGLYWIDTVVGTGDEAVLGATATVLISGWLTDGTLFDTGTNTFDLLPSVVIAGLLEGILGMRVEGTRKLVVPTHLAWGAAGNGAVPPNATVVFEVELQAIAVVE